MPEKIKDRTIFSLSEVTRSIQKTLYERYKTSFWVKAEMNKLNHYPHSGHCYPELVEKKDGKIIAEIRSMLWKDDYQKINNNFLKVLKEPLKNGINILFCAKVSYDPVHGLSLTIQDIDPSYSLGQLEREKQETIDKLKKEGIFNANRSLKMVMLPKKLAVISVQTSKGYSDFLKVVEGNAWGYKIFQMLFPAILQGERGVDSILAQLKRIKKVHHHFDAVAIIRGGGGDIGLTCYNNYILAKEIVLFPIPVITGIGHSTNETVAEMVAYKNAITPTELGDYLLQKFRNYDISVQKSTETFRDKSQRLLKENNAHLKNTVKYFRSVTISMLMKKKNEIHQMKLHASKGISRSLYSYRQHIALSRIKFFERIGYYIKSEHKIIEGMEKSIGLLDPINVLKRGYSITWINGKVLKKAEEVKEGDQLKTLISDGEILSITKNINKFTNDER